MSPSLQSFNTEPCEKQGTGNVSELEVGRASKLIIQATCGKRGTSVELYGVFASVSGGP